MSQHSHYIKFCWRLLSTPASRVFLYSRKTLHELSKILVELSLHVARMQFEPRPNSRELGTASSVMIIGLATKECSHLKKLVWCAKTRLTSPEVWAAATSKIWCNSARVSFSPSHLILQISISSYKFSKHLHTFPVRITWENLIKDHGIFPLMIILLILIILSHDNVWILLGENCCWSLLALEGLTRQKEALLTGWLLSYM